MVKGALSNLGNTLVPNSPQSKPVGGNELPELFVLIDSKLYATVAFGSLVAARGRISSHNPGCHIDPCKTGL